MNLPAAHESPHRGNKAITVLRVVVWLIPAFIIPFVAVFGAIGYFDMRLKLQQERIDSAGKQRELLGWAAAFAFIQIIMAPGILYLVIAAISEATGSRWL
jgi:hypothetical protein